MTSPCPEITLNNFCFPVGASLAALWAGFLAPFSQYGLFWAKNAIFSLERHPDVPIATKMLPIWWTVVMVSKFLMQYQKIWNLAKKKRIFTSKISFILRYAHITHFFGLRQTWLNGIITSSCPEVTLDTFSVRACSTARQVVFWHRLSKWTFLGPIMLCFGLKYIICYLIVL